MLNKIALQCKNKAIKDMINKGEDFLQDAKIVEDFLLQELENRVKNNIAYNDYENESSADIDSILEMLHQYVDIILHHNKHCNLIGRDTESKIWRRHILDSLQLAVKISSKYNIIADLGSGAGLPGIVIAMMRPKSHVILVEKSRKKQLFLKAVSQHINLKNVYLFNNQAQSLHSFCISEAMWPDCITARAFKPLPVILSMMQDFLPMTALYLLKGATYLSEIEMAQDKYSFSYTVDASITDQRGVLLLIKDCKQKK